MQNIEARNDYHWSLLAMFMSGFRPYEQKDFEGMMSPLYIQDSEVL